MNFESLPVTIIRSERRKRTVAIQVRDNALVVRVPESLTDEQVQELLKSRREWIRHSRKRSPRLLPLAPELPQSKFWYRGRLLTLCFEPWNQQQWKLQADEQYLRLHGPVGVAPPLNARELIYHWYRNEAKRLFPERLLELADSLNVGQFTVRIKHQVSRWGSCSSSRNINLNWRLIMAPPEVADYVMIHELCHLREMNHSPRFWRLVEAAMPDFGRHRQWLKEYGDSRLSW